MYCRSCGQTSPVGAMKCTACGAPFAMGAVPMGASGKPNNFLVPAILATIFCCLPLGVVSIVFAAQVDSKWNAGDYAAATEAASKAKMFFWISFGVGLVLSSLYAVYMVIMALTTFQGF